MDRQAFLGAIGCIVASVSASAQQAGTTRRIGSLLLEAPLTPEEIERRRMPAVLRRLGWIEGQNLIVERRYASFKRDLLKPLAEELVRLKVDLIVAEGTIAAVAAKEVTSTTPIAVLSIRRSGGCRAGREPGAAR